MLHYPPNPDLAHQPGDPDYTGGSEEGGEEQEETEEEEEEGVDEVVEERKREGGYDDFMDFSDFQDLESSYDGGSYEDYMDMEPFRTVEEEDMAEDGPNRRLVTKDAWRKTQGGASPEESGDTEDGEHMNVDKSQENPKEGLPKSKVSWEDFVAENALDEDEPAWEPQVEDSKDMA